MNRTIGCRIFLGIWLLVFTSICISREETWTEVTSPNFTVISDASPKQARQTATSLEQFRLLLRTVLPWLKADPGSPLIIFAARNEKSLDALNPEKRESKNQVQHTGVFRSSMEGNFVALRLDLPEDQAFHTIHHEYVHLILRLNFPKIPLWLNEGMAELFAFARVSGGESSLGDPSRNLLETLKQHSMIPLATLMGVTHDSPYYRQADKTEMFYAQSWALAHYLMTGDKGAHSKQLDQYLNLIQDGLAEEEARARAFADLKALQENLRNYINTGVFYHIPARLNFQNEEYPARSLAPAESLALRAQFLVNSERLEEAKTMLSEALQLDARSPQANEGMGMLSLKLGNQEQARNYFMAAMRQNSKSFLPYYFAAQLEFEKGENYAAAETYLRKALGINPSFVPTYTMLAHILSLQETTRPEALKIARAAADLEPAEPRHCLNVCEILMAMEGYDEATVWAERALALASSGTDTYNAKSMLSRIAGERERKRREKLDKENYLRQARQMEQQQSEAAEMKKQLAPDIKKGPPGKVIGLIKSVQCGYPAIMDIVLDSGGKQQKFRAENYYKIEYEAIGGPGKTEFEPCEELQGKRVEIDFLSITNHEFSGIINKVGIVK